MAIMATQSATSSKKAESHESPGERDAARNEARDVARDEPGARPGVGKKPCDKGSPRSPSAEPDTLDAALEDPYDNVACTD